MISECRSALRSISVCYGRTSLSESGFVQTATESGAFGDAARATEKQPSIRDRACVSIAASKYEHAVLEKFIRLPGSL